MNSHVFVLLTALFLTFNRNFCYYSCSIAATHPWSCAHQILFVSPICCVHAITAWNDLSLCWCAS